MKLPQKSETSDRSSPKFKEIGEFIAKQRAIAEIRQKKLHEPEAPRDKDGHGEIRPKLPFDLGSIAGGRLAELLTHFSAMADYIAYESAKADIEMTEAENIYEFVSASVRLEKSGTVQEKGDKTTQDPRVREAQRHYLEKYSISRLTEVLLKNVERDLSAVSREITRRGNEQNRN